MVFFATRFLKQLEQNEKAPKQITSRYLSIQSSVLFKKDLPREFIPILQNREKKIVYRTKAVLSAQNPLIMVF